MRQPIYTALCVRISLPEFHELLLKKGGFEQGREQVRVTLSSCLTGHPKFCGQLLCL